MTDNREIGNNYLHLTLFIKEQLGASKVNIVLKINII